jgi:hypothetical protein
LHIQLSPAASIAGLTLLPAFDNHRGAGICFAREVFRGFTDNRILMYNDFIFEKERAIMVSQINPPTDPRNTDKNKARGVSLRGMLSLVSLVMSAISLGIALTGGAVVIFAYFEDRDTNGLWAKIIVLALAYIVGWGAALIGIRKVGNLILPYLIQGYAWICMAGVGLLDIVIISKLYKQEYGWFQFWTYVIVMVAALVALVGIHLLFENHNLIPFAIPLLLISLGQLYLIVIRYVFIPVNNYVYLWGDLGFFTLMTTIGILMMVRVGVLTSVRKFLGNLFKENEPFQID